MGTPRRAARVVRSGLAAAVAIALLTAACGGDDGASADTGTPGEAPRLVAVSLGDSYASGAGAPPYDKGSGSCQRSKDAWARLLETDSPAVASLDHRACGGARTKHLTGPWADRGLPPQIPTTPEPEVTLVMVTVGGNDVGFGSTILACTLANCPPARSFAEPLEKLDTALRSSLYPALHRAYPNARIVHVGYPRLTPPVGTAPVRCSWLSEADQGAAAETIEVINRTIDAATRGADVTYVDVSEVLAGHEMCTEIPWMRNLGEDSAVHPTRRGQVAIERAVAEALDIQIDG